MSEVRVDPLSGRRTILAPRDVRLRSRPAAAINPAGDPYAAGRESGTAPELAAVRPGGGAADGPGWTVRVVPSDAPALGSQQGAGPPADASPALYTAVAGVGAHEVIVNAPGSVAALAELDVDQVVAAVEIWRERMIFNEGAACLHLSVDERPGEHTRAELLALDFVPADIARERERFGAYAVRTNGCNLQADLVQEEVRRRVRVVAIDDEAVLLAPYASRRPYQLMLAPRRPRARFQDAGPTGAGLLHDGLRRLARRLGGSPPLHLWVRTAPRGADVFCWRIDILPRLGGGGGLDLGTGVPRNPLAPEQAASDLRCA